MPTNIVSSEKHRDQTDGAIGPTVEQAEKQLTLVENLLLIMDERDDLRKLETQHVKKLDSHEPFGPSGFPDWQDQRSWNHERNELETQRKQLLKFLGR